MRVELRADGLHISGYVNIPGRPSRPVTTPHGRVIEIIEQRAFERAIKRAGNIQMLLDHDHGRVLAETSNGTLSLKEDAVGLRAESVVTDPEVIAGAKAGRLRGWSFDIRNPKDYVEERAEGLPVRHITDLDMTEVTLAMSRIPVYASTSIEVRAGSEDENVVEYRGALQSPIEFSDMTEEKAEEQRSTEPEVREKPDYHSPLIKRTEDQRYIPTT